MTAFVAQVEARETELVRERDENRQLCEDYVAQVDKKQEYARGILACIQDTDTTGNAEPKSRRRGILPLVGQTRTAQLFHCRTN